MNNKVYYGEYSLKHWIELMLKGNIILPPYQRFFVWKKDDINELIKAFKDNKFIPPIIIGAFENKKNKKTENLIIDGQQRLTSLLLAYLGLFPDAKGYKEIQDQIYSSESEGVDADDYLNNLHDVIDWKFEKLIEKGNTKEDILAKIENQHYEKYNYGLDNDTLKNRFLGFSYLVPGRNNKKITTRILLNYI